MLELSTLVTAPVVWFLTTWLPLKSMGTELDPPSVDSVPLEVIAAVPLKPARDRRRVEVGDLAVRPRHLEIGVGVGESNRGAAVERYRSRRAVAARVVDR